MRENPFHPRRISHYGAMSKLDLDTENRATIVRLLAGPSVKLAVTTAVNAKLPGRLRGGSQRLELNQIVKLYEDLGVAIGSQSLRVAPQPRILQLHGDAVELISEGLVTTQSYLHHSGEA